MRLRVAGVVLAGVLTAAVHGCNEASPAADGGSPGGTRDRGSDGRVESAGPDAPAVLDVAADLPAGIDAAIVRDVGVGGADLRAGEQRDAANDVARDVARLDTARSCATQTIILGRGGTTSSCSWKVPTTVPRDRVNLLIGGGRLCKQGSNNCTSRGGWFWFGDEVALCDATCISWEESGANLILEAGCPSESCFVACQQAGGRCGDGVNSCCVGCRCASGTCAACVRGGQACTATSNCCSGSCQNGTCVGGLGGACVSQAGCSQGECRDGRCQCEVDQIQCSSGCVSYTDPSNCRGCGNVCNTSSGRVCTTNGCVCDPQSGRPDECNGACVDKATDRNHCGVCFNTCPRLEQVCLAGKCSCLAGMTDCNGTCVDTATNQNHCGMCNRSCPSGTEICSGGNCACAPGRTRCSGTCVNLQTDKLNCNACGVACPGNKTCNNGVCG